MLTSNLVKPPESHLVTSINDNCAEVEDLIQRAIHLFRNINLLKKITNKITCTSSNRNKSQAILLFHNAIPII